MSEPPAKALDTARYVVHGLALASDRALPLPRCPPRAAEISFRTAMSAPMDSPDHSRPDDPDEPWTVEHWVGDRLLVEFPGRATFELSRDEVVLRKDLTEDPDLVDHLFLDHALPRLIALRGDLVLHASGAVGPSGGAHLFLGPTGAGKSTMATSLAAKGWLLVDDDAVRVIEVDGGPHAVPGYAGVRLLPDAATAVLSGVGPGGAMAKGHPKRRFPVDGVHLAMASGPTPIRALHLLVRYDQPVATLTPIGFADAVGVVTGQGFHLAADPGDINRLAFERSTALAAEVPLFELHHPEDLVHLDVTRALLEDLDRS